MPIIRAELALSMTPFARDAAGVEDVLVVIDVVQKAFSALIALAQAALQSPPLVGGTCGNDVEGDQASAGSRHTRRR